MPYDVEDFPMDDMADIDGDFVFSTSDIRPESFDDRYLPVCHLGQRLSLPLLERALDEIETLEDLDTESKTEAIDVIHDLGECFPDENLNDDR
jgi:hypothetical protein